MNAESIEARRKTAIATIESRYTPRRQVELIEAALLSQRRFDDE